MKATHRVAGSLVVVAGALGGCFSASSGGNAPDASFVFQDSAVSFDAPVESGPPGTFTTGQGATLVLGQPTLQSSNTPNCTASTMATPLGIGLIGGALYVAAESDHRVLIWNNLPTHDGQAADRVLGQPTLGTGNKAT